MQIDHPEPVLCECGRMPSLAFIPKSNFGLRVIGCPVCNLIGPARMSTDEAIQQWNAGHRIDVNGDRVCACCRMNGEKKHMDYRR
jgi:hypothetical protein